MGSRLTRIPLGKATFRILPEAYELRFNVDEDDPEVPHLQRVYLLCYQAVFGKTPTEHNISRSASKIVENARRSDCSIRLYILANMLGHQRMEQARIEQAACARITAFTPWRLTDNRALERARTYAELCRKDFGAFTLSTLSTLAETNSEETDIEKRMLNSEVYVGNWLVSHKIYHEGPPYALMYEQLELDLDPHWLAIEDTYKKLVLDAPNRGGSQELRSKRYSAIQAMGFLKRHKHVAGATFKARQDILPKAVNKVMEHFGFHSDDFLIEDKPITNSLELWVTLGRTIQHWNLLQYLHGGGSLFEAR